MPNFIGKHCAAEKPSVLIRGLKSKQISADYVELRPAALIAILAALVVLSITIISITLQPTATSKKKLPLLPTQSYSVLPDS
jgi:hypothetical protein